MRYLSALDQGAGRMGVFNVARLLIPSVYGGTLLALLLLGVAGVRVFAAAYAGSSALIALVTLLAMSTSETRKGALHPRFDWEMARLSWSIGRQAYFGSLAPVDTLQLERMLTTALLGAQEAGLYFVATSAAAVVRAWGTTFGALSLPRVAGAASRNEALGVMSLFVRLTVVLSGLSAAVLLAFAGPLLTLVYGEDYAPAATLVRILAAGMLAASLRYVLGDGLRGMGHPALATRAEMLGWLGGAVALLVFLPLWGVNGVAVAVSVSFITTLLVMLGFAQRLGAHPARMLVPSRSDFSRGRAMLRGTPKSRER